MILKKYSCLFIVTLLLSGFVLTTSAQTLPTENPKPERPKVGLIMSGGRSEERRVGKEGRSRWSPYH